MNTTDIKRKYLEYIMFLEKENIFNNEEIKNVRKLKRMIINYVKKDVKKELKLIINKELYQKGKITFEEFKLVNEKIMKEKENEYCKN